MLSRMLKTHAIKYSETAGTQSETTVGQKTQTGWHLTRTNFIWTSPWASVWLCEHNLSVCVYARVLLKCAQTWLCYWYCITGSQLSDRYCVSFPSLLGGAVGFSCLMQKTFKVPRKKQQLTSSYFNFQKQTKKKHEWACIYMWHLGVGSECKSLFKTFGLPCFGL